MSTIKGQTGEWEMVIGLEVHAQIISESKLFSGASTTFGAEPNAQVSLVDAAFPGMLPVINKKCVEQAVRTGLGLKAQINLVSIFDRKNYFYPDLPAGYQISQYKHPIVGTGEILLDLPDGSSRTVGITRLHLEQDAGKSMHDQSPNETYVNLSMRRKGVKAYGTRCEIKNVNSIRFVQQAIEYEARRQVEVLEGGGKIAQETRLWDTGKGVTRSMRSKEEAHDYRYFPDPDLLPLKLDAKWVEGIKKTLPELPDEKRARFIEKFALTPYNASVLVAEKEIAD